MYFKINIISTCCNYGYNIIIHELTSLQRNFLWVGSLGESKKVAWVKWDCICLFNELGGLGVENLHMFNLALLGKWIWVFLVTL